MSEPENFEFSDLYIQRGERDLLLDGWINSPEEARELIELFKQWIEGQK